MCYPSNSLPHLPIGALSLLCLRNASTISYITIPTGAVSYTSSSLRFGRGVDTNLTNFLCYGNESQLLNCAYSVTSSCSRDYTAGVLCYGDVVPGVWWRLLGYFIYYKWKSWQSWQSNLTLAATKLWQLTHCKNKLVTWLQPSWRESGYKRFTLLFETNCIRQPEMQLPWYVHNQPSSSYNHDTLHDNPQNICERVITM